MSFKKLFVVVIVAALAGAFFWFDGAQYLSLEIFKQWLVEDPLRAAGIYFGLYVLMAALSVPGALVATMLGGAVFGLWQGVLLVSFASTLGATLSFLVARTVLADTVNKKFGHYLDDFNRGVERDGAFYLFTLRLIPVPFVVINLVFGLTKIKTWTFYWVSQVGMLIGTFVFVNAGAQLREIDELSAAGILTPKIIGAFALLAVVPLIVRMLVNKYRHWNAYKSYTKPKEFDVNLIVIGAGSAGLVSSYIAAAVKAKVVLIEKHKMGGDCLNTGCVPSKALIRAAKAKHMLKHAHELGIENATGEVNLSKVFNRVNQVIKDIEPHDSIERYTKLGVKCVQGDATVVSPYGVMVNGRVITAKNIIIATGARPFVPPIPGLDQVSPLTSDNLWSIEEFPQRLLIMGAGPIGCELAQSFQRLGVEVTLVDMSARLMPREDEDVSEYILERFLHEGVRVLLNQQIVGFEKSASGSTIASLRNGSGQQTVECDRVLVAVGRKANTEGFGLESLGIEISPQGTVVVDEYLRTRFPNIYACGDVAGPYQFTHTAAHQAWYASVNALFGKLKKFRVDYKVIPWATFTDPEVARVGLSEAEAQQKGQEYDVTRYELDDLDRAITDNEARGFVKVLTVKGSDRILGCTIVGAHGGELITEFVTAMKYNLGLNKILGTIHIYPTMSEANKYIAGEWKRAHVSKMTLKLLEMFHRWMR
jgi:dihydrolipoamide dehydrogenase